MTTKTISRKNFLLGSLLSCLLVSFEALAATDIHTCTDLQNMNLNLVGEYVLANDIDCSSVNNFAPINNFTGTLDGNGYKISNLSINVTDPTASGGLFATVSNATIKNLIFDNVKITGTQHLGALVGVASGIVVDNVQVRQGIITVPDPKGSGNFNEIGGLVGALAESSTFVNTIQNSSSSATVEGGMYAGSAIGGLVGWMSDNSTIDNSYATGNVDGFAGVGGLVGTMGGVVKDSYATGKIGGSGGPGNNYMGGLIGDINKGQVLNSYALGSISGDVGVGGLIGNNDGGTVQNSYAAGKVTSSDYNQSNAGGLVGISSGSDSVVNSYWDTQSSGIPYPNSSGGTGLTTAQMYKQASYQGWDFSNTWNIHDGSSYPWLRSSDVHEIKSCADWQGMQQDLTATYRFVADIDCSGSTVTPIGNSQTMFTGSLNGDGYAIGNAQIHNDTQTDVGLFGATKGAYISNLVIKNVNVSGGGTVGALAGYASGTQISEIVANGTVQAKGYSNIGGLIGLLDTGSTLAQSSANIATTGTNNVGGLIGVNNGSIANSYAVGTVDGVDSTGGLVGGNVGTIDKTYATGKVSGSYNVGGLIGFLMNGTVTNSYWDTQTSDQTASAAGAGKTTAEMNKQSTYVGWDFTNIWNISDGLTYPWLMNQPGPAFRSKNLNKKYNK